MIVRSLSRSLPGCLAVVVMIACLPVRSQASSEQSGSVWLNTDQQARRWLEQGNLDALQASGTVPDWTGAAQYRAGQHDLAAEQFSIAADRAAASGNEQALTRALYNRATAQLKNGELDQALSGFDQVLEREPSHADALTNRAIAEALQEHQQATQAGQNGPGEQSDEGTGDQSQSGDTGQGESGEQAQQPGSEGQPGEGQPGEGSSEPPDESQNASGEQSGEAGAGQAPPEQTPGAMTDQTQAEQEAEAARQALEHAAAEPSVGEQGTGEVGEPPLPLSENQQATEQWLRRIPDDPAGLLRRKLLQSHERRYSGVGDGAQPW